MIPPKTISSFAAGLALAALFIGLFMVITAFPRETATDKAAIDRFVDDTMDDWKSRFDGRTDLRVARIDVHFGPEPKDFVKQEGTVVVPVGITLPRGQEIIEMAAYPPIDRQLSVDSITSLAWAYPGLCRTEMNFVALTLVRQMYGAKKKAPERTTFSSLPQSFVMDALVRADEINEHSLQQCAPFRKWAVSLKVPGTTLQQFKVVIENVTKGIVPQDKTKKWDEDICTSLNKFTFPPHLGHVLAVMACRELGVPCFGFIGAEDEANYIVGTYTDQTGWMFFDLGHPKKGFFPDPPVFLTRTPLISEFDACHDGFWKATASGYKPNSWGAGEFTYTEWGKENTNTDYTLARTYRLDGWTPDHDPQTP
jgi:hypothetical protein